LAITAAEGRFLFIIIIVAHHIDLWSKSTKFRIAVPSEKTGMSSKASSVKRDNQGNIITSQVCASPAQN